MPSILNIFKRKKKPEPCCANCKHYTRMNVQGNRLETVTLGLCDNMEVRRSCVPYGRTAQGFYRWDWPAETPYAPISFSPDFICKNYKDR